MVRPMANNSFYEFFAGGGMARAGLGAGWNCLFANDFDHKKAETYQANWGNDVLKVADVAGLQTTDLPGLADLIWASFPCQDLSLAGSGAGLDGSRSGTFWSFWKLVTMLGKQGRKPAAIVLENVCGLLTSRDGADFRALVETVAGDGYWVGAIVADAADFLPQSRPRLFIVAIALEQAIAGRTRSAFATDLWHPERLRRAQALLSQTARARWMWFSPPAPPTRNLQLADIVENTPIGVTWHDEAETSRLLDMMSKVNRTKVDRAAGSGLRAVGTIYKRTRVEPLGRKQRAEVRFDMAGCLRTPGGGSSRQTIIVIDEGKIRTRLISPRETARLMGLPDAYILPARYNDAYHVTGDGVAVPVVRHIIQHIVEPCLTALKVTNVAA